MSAVDWSIFEDSELAYWAARARPEDASMRIALGDALRQQAVAQGLRRGRTTMHRPRDFAVHLRVSEVLARVPARDR